MQFNSLTYIALFQRKRGLHLILQVAGSGVQARKFGGLRASLTLFVKYVWMGMSGGGDGPEISPNTPKDSMAQTDGC